MNFMTQPLNKTLVDASYPHLHLLWRLNHKESKLKLSLEVYSSEDVIVVGCKGRVVFGNETAALCSKVAELLPQARKLVLELSEVESMDGAGLGELMILRNLASSHGCAIDLVAPNSRVRDLLELTHLNTVFEIHPTLGDAMIASRSQVA